MPAKKTRLTKPVQKKATIYKLAEETGYSPSTISRALRNQPDISAETREIVRKHADAMGFKLRVFESRITNICALIQTQPNQTSLFSSFTDAIMDGMWRYCTENDLELSVFGATAERLNSGDLGRVLGRRGVSGAVVLNASDESRFFAKFNQERFPYTCVATAPPEAMPNLVTGNNEQLARQAIAFLRQIGHRRIAMLDSLSEHLQAGVERREAFFAAMAKAEPMIIQRRDLIGTPIDDYEFARLAAQHLLGLPKRPTAIVAMSAEQGLSVIHTAGQLGVRVPQNLSVLCFDDSRLCGFTTPSLTVASVSYQQIGYVAAQIVHRKIEKSHDSAVGQVLNGELVIRESTAPPATKLND
jgi:LacI family transcriptional regulator